MFDLLHPISYSCFSSHVPVGIFLSSFFVKASEDSAARVRREEIVNFIFLKLWVERELVVVDFV